MQHTAIQDCQLQSEDDGWQDIDFSGHDSLFDHEAFSPNLRITESLFNTSSFKTAALHEQLPSGLVIDQYRLVERIGCGSFGAAYTAEDMCRGCEVVLKCRVSDASDSAEFAGTTRQPQFSENLRRELEVYSKLEAALNASAPNSIPEIYSEVPQGKDAYRQWMCSTGKGMLQALASMHARGFIHRDVKTENFCFDLPGGSGVYIIDMGFARQAFGYYGFETYCTSYASFWGTPNYASLDSLRRHPQTPRDDLEALVYCLLELEMRSHDFLLPWNDTLTTNEEAAE
eukprot:gene13731-13853_t